MIEKNLQKRGNWYRLNDIQVIKNDLIDFCFTNWSKLQTRSIIHNRILLDDIHFISDKLHYYNTFKEYNFIPIYENITNIDNIQEINKNLILKPAKGSLSIGIKILNKTHTKKDIEKHIKIYSKFKEWILSELYISKKWIDGCIISNRIYYLVRKIRIKNILYITGFWFDEFIQYKASCKYDDDEKNISKKLITNLNNDEENSIDFFNKRVISHEKYLTLFTELEWNEIKNKISNNLNIITKKISEHLTCSNDYTLNYNDNTGENKNISFHLYGVDSLIMDNLDLKFIEINGAPSIIYIKDNFINYNILINEMLKLTVDVLYNPLNNIEYLDNDKGNSVYGLFKNNKEKTKFFDRKFIQCGEFTKQLKIPIYISKEINDIYPFILKGILSNNRNLLYQQIKNPHCENIFLFYGLRDRYIHNNINKSNLNFYDELIEYRVSNNGRNSKILNKIQGITYYLASKDRLYDSCKNFPFMPTSFIFNIETGNSELLKTFMIINSDKSQYYIIKPVYGSQGKGIIIIPSKLSIDICIQNMLCIKKDFGYAIFIISVYINNPKLHTDLLLNKKNTKFNLRFYALLNIKNKNLNTVDNNNLEYIHYYILKDVQIYFSILPYDTSINNITDTLIDILNVRTHNNYLQIYEKINKLPLFEIYKLINLTNLQIVKNLSEYLNIPISLSNFLSNLEQLNYNSILKTSIFYQASQIIYKTLFSIKQHLRHLNRNITNSSAFNLIAYDTMLDDSNILHLIEINRGPDLHGLELTIGKPKITNIFTEIFDIVIDNKTKDLTYFIEKKLI